MSVVYPEFTLKFVKVLDGFKSSGKLVGFMSTTPGAYAHIEIVVAFLVVNFFGFLVITRDHGSYEGHH